MSDHHFASIYDHVFPRFAPYIICPRLQVLANKFPCRRMHYYSGQEIRSLVSAVHHIKSSKILDPVVVNPRDAKYNQLCLMYAVVILALILLEGLLQPQAKPLHVGAM
jgi:hypothetical protein